MKPTAQLPHGNWAGLSPAARNDNSPKIVILGSALSDHRSQKLRICQSRSTSTQTREYQSRLLLGRTAGAPLLRPVLSAGRLRKRLLRLRRGVACYAPTVSRLNASRWSRIKIDWSKFVFEANLVSLKRLSLALVPRVKRSNALG
jgi:hypothetical protein